MDSNPFVSIIIPIYNSEKYLNRCLDSVFNQKYANYEVICIDDGSTDKSGEICSKYNVKYLKQQNRGQASARNRGIEEADGDWICFVDSDDTIEPNYLFNMVDSIEDDVNMIVCRIKRINNNETSKVDVTKRYGVISSKEALTIVNIGPTNKLIRKNIIGDCRFIEGKIRFEDILFTPELIIKAKKIKVIDDVLYNYYVRDDSTMRLFDETLKDIFVVLDNLINKYYYPDYKNELDYIIFKNGLFGHMSRIVYLDNKTRKIELKKAEEYIKKNIPDYRKNKYIVNDKQPYFYVGYRLFAVNLLSLLFFPLSIMEKGINR